MIPKLVIKSTFLVSAILICCKINCSYAQKVIITDHDFAYLQELAKAVVDSSRIKAGQELIAPFGTNNTGGTLIRPGGRETYPSFWIRDYAMSLETGFVTEEEQRHMLTLAAATQCNQSWITKGGSLVPYGAIADHIRVDDSRPIYFPGTYDYDGQGTEEFGMTPPYCDQYYFVYMAHYYWRTTKNTKFLKQSINGLRLIDRLEIAFRVPPSREDNGIVFTTDNFRGVDFGFRDAIRISGELAYPSILKYRAANQLAELFIALKNSEKSAVYRTLAQTLKKAISTTFLNNDGMLRASTGKGGQADVWATGLAVYLKVLDDNQAIQAGKHMAKAFRAGKLAYKGCVRHVIHGEDFNAHTAWQDAIVPKNQYQNGAYWGTATGWVAYTISLADREIAAQLVNDYITGLRESDFRKGPNFSGPYECFYPPDYSRGPVYMTTVSSPLIVFSDMRNNN